VSIKVTDAEIDQQIGIRLRNAITTQILADAVMRTFEQDTSINPPPVYIPRKEKRRSRIYAKVRRYLKENRDWDLKKAIENVDDLSGGRFIVHYLNDINKLHTYVCSSLEGRKGYSNSW
jgi:hypothetical protein